MNARGRVPKPGHEAETVLVSDHDVETLLPMPECIELMSDALRALAMGDAQLPLRQVVPLAGTPNLLVLMPAILGPAGPGRTLGAKVITVFPGNDATPFDSHIGVVLLFDSEHGRLRAIVDASSVTAIRTAAVSGVATQLLAREDAGDLALLGAGVQAMTHLDAMRAVRRLRSVRVWSRTPERMRSFAAEAERRFAITIETCATAREAVEGADIVCTVTAARQPVLQGSWIAEGAHVNAVGAALATARELDSEAVRRASVFVDRRESALNEAGDLLMPIREGVIDEKHIKAELGELLTGKAAGRESDSAITLFKSLGLAIEDLAAARHIHERASRGNAGRRIAIGGLRDRAGR